MTVPINTNNPCSCVAQGLRRSSAEALYHLLVNRTGLNVSYDGEFTVDAGPVHIEYGARTVEIWFPDAYSTTVTDSVAVYLPNIQHTALGGVVTLVEGLLTQIVCRSAVFTPVCCGEPMAEIAPNVWVFSGEPTHFERRYHCFTCARAHVVEVTDPVEQDRIWAEVNS